MRPRGRQLLPYLVFKNKRINFIQPVRYGPNIQGGHSQVGIFTSALLKICAGCFNVRPPDGRRLHELLSKILLQFLRPQLKLFAQVAAFGVVALVKITAEGRVPVIRPRAAVVLLQTRQLPVFKPCKFIVQRRLYLFHISARHQHLLAAFQGPFKTAYQVV